MSKIVKKRDITSLVESTLKEIGVNVEPINESKPTKVEKVKEEKPVVVESKSIEKPLINEQMESEKDKFNKLINFNYKY